MASSINSLGWMGGAGALLQMFGMFESGRSARIAGEQAKVAAEFAARQAEEEAGLSIAVGQHRAEEAGRQTQLEASRALAVAASSGGGTTDPTIVRLLANVKGMGAYRANVALYEGEARARKLRLEAASGRVSGAESLTRGLADEEAHILGGVGAGVRGAADVYAKSLYQKYGFGGPKVAGDAGLITDNPSWKG